MNKFAFLAVSACALAASLPAIAQPSAGGMTLADMQTRMHARFARMDTNHDGRLTAAERDAARQARMAAQGGAGGQGQGGGGRGGGMMGMAGDADLTLAQLDARIAQRFARMDANHDGRLTPDERPARREGARAPGAPDAPGL